MVNPLVTSTYCMEIPDLYPACAGTSVLEHKAKQTDGKQDFDLTDTILGQSFKNEKTKSPSYSLHDIQIDIH